MWVNGMVNIGATLSVFTIIGDFRDLGAKVEHG